MKAESSRDGKECWMLAARFLRLVTGCLMLDSGLAAAQLQAGPLLAEAFEAALRVVGFLPASGGT